MLYSKELKERENFALELHKELNKSKVSVRQAARELEISLTYFYDILNGSRGNGKKGQKKLDSIREYINKLKKERAYNRK